MEDSASAVLAREFQSLLDALGIEGEKRKVLLSLPDEQKLHMINAQKKSAQISGMEIAKHLKNIKRPFSVAYSITDIEEYIKEIRILRLKFVEITEKEVEKAIDEDFLKDIWGIISSLSPKAELGDARMYLQIENSKQNKPIYKILEPTVNFFRTVLKSPAVIKRIQKDPVFFKEIFMHFPSEYADISTIILQIAVKCSNSHMDILLDYLFKSSKHEMHAYCIPACDIQMKKILDELYYNLSFRTMSKEYVSAFLLLMIDLYSEPPMIGIMLDSLLRMCGIGRILSKIESTFYDTRKTVGELIDMQEKVRSLAGEIDVREITIDTEETKKDLVYIINVLSVLNRINSSRIYDVLQYIRGCILEESLYKNKDIKKIEIERAIRKEKTEKDKESYKCICKDIILGNKGGVLKFESPSVITANLSKEKNNASMDANQANAKTVGIGATCSTDKVTSDKSIATNISHGPACSIDGVPEKPISGYKEEKSSEGMIQAPLNKKDTDAMIGDFIKRIADITLTKEQQIKLRKLVGVGQQEGEESVLEEGALLGPKLNKINIPTPPSGMKVPSPPLSMKVPPPLGKKVPPPPSMKVPLPPSGMKMPPPPRIKVPLPPSGMEVPPPSGMKVPLPPLGMKMPPPPGMKVPLPPSGMKMPPPPGMKVPLPPSGMKMPGNTKLPSVPSLPNMSNIKNSSAPQLSTTSLKNIENAVKMPSIPAPENGKASEKKRQNSIETKEIDSVEPAKPGPRAMYIERAALLHPANPQQLPYDVHIRKPGSTGLWSMLDKTDLSLFTKEDFSIFERKRVDKLVEEEKIVIDEVMDKKRCKAIDIVLARVKIPYEKLISAVEELDTKPFTETLLLGLLKNYPTEEELDLIQKNPVYLAPEIFFKKVAHAHLFKDKLMILHLKLTQPTIETILIPNVHKLTEGCRILLQKRSIHEILRITLGVINILNANGRNQGAWGIKLESFTRIPENVNILHLIQKKIKEKKIELGSAFAVLKEVVKISTDIIDTDCMEYNMKKELIHAISLPKKQQQSLSALLNTLDSLQKEYLRWKSIMEELRIFMGEKELTGTGLQTLSKYIITVLTPILPKK
ncbi:hypothetical protein NEPAR06_0646 [Nematocida parisii]|uniref:FH2 domain-containing protein n=1 Tax=Nematocida parisii (strain ERTm3) TaxID=935791 RepID=I3EEZ1_NEMP3|nr:uncharacterized protein NEPG_01968 [Nematocida parisii ERTm1]EIJ87788.1 hypothetical protein NEQG_01860 [Nematocida parisii ERTm3]KAI5127232.1 hypothetical protein NEPAR08_0829 [Nematocida parisii]EIJ93013.1 hypothetical protein NEPG_01968 [Nematocida parisii ERTm1]KAI5127271.1 hypothetical protein NEPAR03_0875 [Nematocida parisii]KAI5141379.1 hypothetical protein NEPAR04_0932 [Nematocida parisii]|eukprot:XP_013059796.1 hypothetical protein NEPG_01968 [Nematocida parisii ERTm1]